MRDCRRSASDISEIISCSSSIGVGRLFFGSLLSTIPGNRTNGAGSRTPPRRSALPAKSAFAARAQYFLTVRCSGPARRGCRQPGSAVRRPALQLDRLVTRPQHAERIHRLIPKNPCIFAMASPLHRHHGPAGLGHSHQPPGITVQPLRVIYDVGTKHDASPVQISVIPDRRRGEGDLFLCHIFVRRERSWSVKLCRSALDSSAPNTGSMPRDGNAGFTTTLLRLLQPNREHSSARTTTLPRRAI